MPLTAIACTLGAILAVSPAAEEQTRVVDVEVDPSVVDAQRIHDETNPGFGNAIDLDAETGARPADALPEVLSRAPGAAVRSLGGLGQFSSVSLRGSTSQQVVVFLDGVPLGHAGLDGVDLSALSLDSLSRVDVYRGYVPVSFGAAAVGGAIDLRTRPASGRPRLRQRGGVGSFGAADAGASLSLPLAEGASLTSDVGWARARGDFPFYDTNGTIEELGDDRETVRQNADYQRLQGRLAFDLERGGWRFGVTELARWSERGVPGPANAQARAARLEEARARTMAHVGRTGLGPRARGSVRWIASGAWLRRTWRDPLGEVGVGVDDQRLDEADLYLSPRVGVGLWRGAELRLVGDYDGAWVNVDQRVEGGATSGDARRRRDVLGVGAELHWRVWNERLWLVPAMRLDAVQSRFAVAEGEGEASDRGRDELRVGPSPRLAATFRTLDWLSLRASAGRFYRPPTTTELFGDRGFAVGNEGLVPERGTNVDGGLIFDERFGATSPSTRDDVQLRVHVAGFASWTEDLIAWVQAGPAVRPVNVEGARIAGLESGLTLEGWSRALVLQASYTFLDTLNLSQEAEQRGRALPGRPRHDLFARLSTGAEFRPGGFELEPRVFYTFELISGTYLDPSERVEVPLRTLHGLGVELALLRRVHLAFEIRNLFDARTTTWDPPTGDVGPVPTPIADFIGYPLPGRSLWGSLRVDVDFPPRRPAPR